MFGLLAFTTTIYSQNFTTEELIKSWEVKGVLQTLEAQKTYSDLTNHFVPVKFRTRMAELHNYLNKNPSDRLKIRIKMYEIIGDMKLNHPSHWKPKEEITQLFKYALILKDNQLLSELYTLYADRNIESIDNNLFYLTKAIEIQSQIGENYFPKLYLYQYLTGLSYYTIEQFPDAIAQTRNCLENLPNPETNLKIHILSQDLLGTLYDRMQKQDSSLYYYQSIQKTLDHYKKNFAKYQEGFEVFDKDFVVLWNGIADGGIGQYYLRKGEIQEAETLLFQNLSTSLKFKQFQDVAKVQNKLGLLHENTKNYKEAIRFRRNAFLNGVKSKSDHQIIEASKSLEKLYQYTSKYDSVYYYNNQKHLALHRLSKKINDAKHQTIQQKLQHENLVNLISEAEKILAKQRNTRNFFLIGILILILVLYYFYKRNVFKQKLKILNLEKKHEISELKLIQSQHEISEAKKQLQIFKNKLKHNQSILEKFSIIHATPKESIPELQDLTILTKDDWENFKRLFSKVHPNCIQHIKQKYPTISEAELRFICLVKLNLQQNEIASALGISESSIRVTWHRMRKKFNLEKDISPVELLKIIETTT